MPADGIHEFQAALPFLFRGEGEYVQVQCVFAIETQEAGVTTRRVPDHVVHPFGCFLFKDLSGHPLTFHIQPVARNRGATWQLDPPHELILVGARVAHGQGHGRRDQAVAFGMGHLPFRERHSSGQARAPVPVLAPRGGSREHGEEIGIASPACTRFSFFLLAVKEDAFHVVNLVVGQGHAAKDDPIVILIDEGQVTPCFNRPQAFQRGFRQPALDGDRGLRVIGFVDDRHGTIDRPPVQECASGIQGGQDQQGDDERQHGAPAPPSRGHDAAFRVDHAAVDHEEHRGGQDQETAADRQDGGDGQGQEGQEHQEEVEGKRQGQHTGEP